MPPPESLTDIPIVSSAETGSIAHSKAPVSLETTSAASASAPPGSLACTQDSASLVCNLLPGLGQPAAPPGQDGIYVGEGLLPVPAKLAEKITRWDFVDMAELLPEFWTSVNPRETASNAATTQNGARRKRAVTDIATWLQCFATYTSVMSTAHPQAVPELLAYLIFVLRASQDFGGVAWATYDAAFRRQASITGNRQWSRVNPSLYSICFSGVARSGTRCDLCLSLSHPTRDCSLAGGQDSEVSSRLKTLESAVLAITSQVPQQPHLQLRERSPEVCRNWNSGRCRMLHCRYRHACRVCGGPNPAYACCDRALGMRSDPNMHPLGRQHVGGPYLGPGPSSPGPGSSDRSTRIRRNAQPY